MAKAVSSGHECCANIRLLIVILATLCPVICYISRLNLSMAIVAMVNEPEDSTINTKAVEMSVPMSASIASIVNTPPSIIDNSSSSNISFNSSNNNNSNNASITSISPDSSGLAPTLSPEVPPTSAPEVAPDLSYSTALSWSSDLVEHLHQHHHHHEPFTCPAPGAGSDADDSLSSKKPTYGPKYDWTNIETGHITSAFFWTYVLCQVPMARIAEIVGAKWIMAGAGIGSALLSLVAPLAASINLYLFALTRAIMGACQTAMFPAGYILYAKWLPPAERSVALPILYMGAYIGSIVSSTLTGLLCESPIGWPSVFYLSGAACAVWSITWVLFASSEPRTHKCISLREIEYIEAHMESTIAAGNLNNNNNNNYDAEFNADSATYGANIASKPKVPSWRKILTSVPVWAMVSTFFSSNWAFAVIMLLLPSYFNFVLHIPTLKNGIINSVLFAVFCVASPIVGSVSTAMIQTRACGMSRLQIRKLFEGVAIIGQSVCFAAMPLMGCDQTLVLGLLFVQIILYSLINGGEVQLPSELTLDFSGTIYALANSIGSSTGFLVPIVHGWIVTDRNDRNQWNTFFYLASIVTAIGAVIFLIYGRNDLQDFAQDDDDDDDAVNQKHKQKQIDLQIKGQSYIELAVGSSVAVA